MPLPCYFGSTWTYAICRKKNHPSLAADLGQQQLAVIRRPYGCRDDPPDVSSTSSRKQRIPFVNHDDAFGWILHLPRGTQSKLSGIQAVFNRQRSCSPLNLSLAGQNRYALWSFCNVTLTANPSPPRRHPRRLPANWRLPTPLSVRRIMPPPDARQSKADIHN